MKVLLLAALLVLGSFVCGCGIDMSTRQSKMTPKEKCEFADMVAERVVELQKQRAHADR